MTDQELREIHERAAAASPGPWFTRLLDDDYAMNLVAITNAASDEDSWSEPDGSELVAATLVQHPRYVCHDDGRWDENADFIAHAREDVPRLLAEVARLRSLLEPPAPPLG